MMHWHDCDCVIGFKRAAVIALVAMLVLATPATSGAQVVHTDAGDVAGTTSNGVAAFKGIPYAAPPVGANRWRAPQPAAPWRAVRDASTYGADCAQAPFPPDAAPIRTRPAEDCLFLNVWKPAGATPSARLPVMVWVHGGGFVNGGSSPAVYDGGLFARDGLVFVSLNYRLGRFGFFAHPALAGEGASGNFGFLDQIAALRWVRSNVAAFGGDPDNVTVFGESAGGMSMHMLLQAPAARGLFARVIIESGGGRPTTMAMADPERALAAGAAFAPGLDAAALRALPAERVTGNLSLSTSWQPGFSGPMVDGQTVFGTALDVAASGRYAPVPVLIGANSADGFAPAQDKAQIFARYGSQAAQAQALYDRKGDTAPLVVATQADADRRFIEPARAMARTLAGRQPVWLYRFAYARPEALAETGGAPHASEIPFAFATIAARRDVAVLPAENLVARQMHAAWVAFARTGRPDGDPALPAWPRAVPGDTTVQVIDAAGSRHMEDPIRMRLDFVESRAQAQP